MSIEDRKNTEPSEWVRSNSSCTKLDIDVKFNPIPQKRITYFLSYQNLVQIHHSHSLG